MTVAQDASVKSSGLRLAITGHRPEDLPGKDAHEWLVSTLTMVFHELNVSLVIQGMAAGADLCAAEAAIQSEIPFIAVKPWRGHGPRMGDEVIYQRALDCAQDVIEICGLTSFPGASVYHQRNEYMVDNVDAVLGVWNGKFTGGTAACLRYARKIGRRTYIIDPERRKVLGWDPKDFS